MELTYDWRSFQSFFSPKRRGAVLPGQESSPIYLVVEGDRIVCAFAEGEDLSEWVGATYSELAAQITHRELILFSREEADRCLQESLSHAHFYDQTTFIRGSVAPQHLIRSRFKRGSKGLTLKQGLKLPYCDHFLLQALHGWLNRLMPASYGIFIRLEGSSQELLLVMKRGKLDLFCEPDLSFLGSERRKQPADVVKYLSEKYLVPVQGLFVPAEKWKQWAESENPWREVAAAIRGGKNAQARFVPFNWKLVSMISLKGIIGF